MPQAPALSFTPLANELRRMNYLPTTIRHSNSLSRLRASPLFPMSCEDVHMDLLTISETTTHYSFKGNRVYFALGDIKDIAWSYEQPIDWIDAIASKAALACRRGCKRVGIVIVEVSCISFYTALPKVG